MLSTYEIEKITGDAIKTFGERNQVVVAIEELSELQKELCKRLRGFDNAEHIAEEVADVLIMIEQLVQMLGINDDVNLFLDSKLLRLKTRIEEKRERESHE